MNRKSVRGTTRHTLRWLGVLLVIAGVVAAGTGYVLTRRVLPAQPGALAAYGTLLTRELAADRALDDIPANTWVKIHQPWRADWRRQAHGGAAYDSKRGQLLLFGSDTHGLNWDNRLHVFDPAQRAWSSPYPESAPDSYRVDEQGRAIAGDEAPRPWAMHTYDSVIYDAGRDALVVAARPPHNPKLEEFGERARHLSWSWDLARGQWGFLEQEEAPRSPRFFATAAAYDPLRDTLIVYGDGIWEMGPARRQWVQASAEHHHGIHFSVEFDPVRNQLAVFGDYRNTNHVWLYRPGPGPGDAGAWEERLPVGDAPPPGQTLPVAYDLKHHVYLLIVDRAERAAGADTWLYDPDANRYRRLPLAATGRLGMHYNLVYDALRDVFLLVTGDWRTPPVVWALRLSPRLLRE